MTRVSRSRWAAVGAAVAITLGAGGVGLVGATSPAGASAFVPIEPCRLADTRPNTIGPNSSLTFDGWGTTGACALPADTTGLALNVTAVDATQQTNLRFYPAGNPVPATANLNPTPGAPPTPNAVNVTVNTSNGKFSVYNRFGTVAVVIDVMGFYTDHDHDDRYYTETEVDTKLAALNTAQIVPINHRATAPSNGPLVELNGIAVQVNCAAGDEEISVTNNSTSEGELSAISHDASSASPLDPYGVFNDAFGPTNTVVVGPGPNAAHDRQYTITYSAADGRNVTVWLVTEDNFGPTNCLVSGFAMGTP